MCYEAPTQLSNEVNPASTFPFSKEVGIVQELREALPLFNQLWWVGVATKSNVCFWHHVLLAPCSLSTKVFSTEACQFEIV